MIYRWSWESPIRPHWVRGCAPFDLSNLVVYIYGTPQTVVGMNHTIEFVLNGDRSLLLMAFAFITARSDDSFDVIYRNLFG